MSHTYQVVQDWDGAVDLNQFAADVEMVLSCHSAHADTVCVLATALSDVASGMRLPLGV